VQTLFEVHCVSKIIFTNLKNVYKFLKTASDVNCPATVNYLWFYEILSKNRKYYLPAARTNSAVSEV